MIANRHICNALIIIAEYMALRDDMLAAKNNEFLNLEIDDDSKIVIDCYNKKKKVIFQVLLCY